MPSLPHVQRKAFVPNDMKLLRMCLDCKGRPHPSFIAASLLVAGKAIVLPDRRGWEGVIIGSRLTRGDLIVHVQGRLMPLSHRHVAVIHSPRPHHELVRDLPGVGDHKVVGHPCVKRGMIRADLLIRQGDMHHLRLS